MHIPDGFLDLPLAILLYAVSLLLLVPAFRKAGMAVGEKHVPLMSVLTAGVFAAQMLNFPIIFGTSGHLVGGVLIGVFLGPYAAMISMTIVLVIQALLFGDGGIIAMGANIFNMAVVAALSYYVYALIKRGVSGKKGMMAGAFIAAWFSVVLGAIAAAIELGLSSTFQAFGIVAILSAMLFWHIIIGIGEGLITVSVLTFTLRSRPDLLTLPKIAPSWRWINLGEMG